MEFFEKFHKLWEKFRFSEATEIKIKVNLMVSWQAPGANLKEIKKHRQNFTRLGEKSIKIWNFQKDFEFNNKNLNGKLSSNPFLFEHK